MCARNCFYSHTEYFFPLDVGKDYFSITNDHGCVDGTKFDAFGEALLMNPTSRSLDGSYT